MRTNERDSGAALTLPDFVRRLGIVVEAVVEIDRMSLPDDQRMDLLPSKLDARCWDVTLRAHAPGGQDDRREVKRFWSPRVPTAEDVVGPALHDLQITDPKRGLDQFWRDVFGPIAPPFDASTAELLQQSAILSTAWLRRLVGEEALSLAQFVTVTNEKANNPELTPAPRQQSESEHAVPTPRYPMRVSITTSTLRGWCAVEHEAFEAAGRPGNHAYRVLSRLNTQLRIDNADEARLVFDSALRNIGGRLHPSEAFAIAKCADEIWYRCQLPVTPPWRSPSSAFGPVRDGNPDSSEVGDDASTQ
jgi:hypothetical protein